MIEASDEFLVLVNTLLEDVNPGIAVPDVVLLQLHSVFGSMLMSALQLVDRREVVSVTLPGGRTIQQVSSSAGAPYTLYLDLPTPPAPPQTVKTEPANVEPKDEPLNANPPSPSSSTSTPDSPVEPPTAVTPPPEQIELDNDNTKDDNRVTRIRTDAAKLRTMFCPCPGFAYNSLTSDRNVFCKHILAVLLAHRLGKMLETEVGLPAVADLVGVSGG